MSKNKQHLKFPSQKALSPDDYLEAARQAEKYVRTFLRFEPDGLRFSPKGSGSLPPPEPDTLDAQKADILYASKRTDQQGNGESFDDTLYSGGAGVLHMYLQFYQQDPLPEFLDIIQNLTLYLSEHALDTIERAQKKGERVPGMAMGFYPGIAGIGLVLNESYRFFRSQIPGQETVQTAAQKTAFEGVKKITSYYKEQAILSESAAYWTDNSVLYFDGGVILFLLDAYETLQDPSLPALISAATDYILHQGRKHPDGGLEIDHIGVAFKHQEPNFEFGTAGLGYLFLKVYEFTRNEKYLHAAMSTATYIKSIRVPQKKGFLIPYKLSWEQDLFYLGNCHGPVGTIKLFYKLYQLTGEKNYDKDCLDLYEGAASLGAPFSMSPGFWNTTCLCCGPTGYIPLFIGLYKLDGNPRWKDLAARVGDILLGTRSTYETFPLTESHPDTKESIPHMHSSIPSAGPTVCQTGDQPSSLLASRWFLAFDRTKPEEITAPAGYYNGTAGIGAQLLNLYRFLQNQEQFSPLIDDPYLS